MLRVLPPPPHAAAPARPIEIGVVAAVPEALRHAGQLIAARLFEERGDGETADAPKLPR
jgi:hypothetical protein